MQTDAQLTANRANAQSSTGPVSPEGKSRSARNSTTFGLFSCAPVVHPDERELYDQFCASYHADLSPAGALEQTLAAEVTHAAWRLRRCSAIDAGIPLETSPELDPARHSVDRARADAHRTLHRTLAELRRIQTERLYRSIALPSGFNPAAIGIASCKDVKPADVAAKQAAENEARAERELKERLARQRMMSLACMTPPPAAPADFTNRTQSAPPEPPVLTPRGAPCPCGSGIKFKRCCGRAHRPQNATRQASPLCANPLEPAPPVLGNVA